MAQTSSERQRARRKRLKEDAGIVPYSSEIYESDKAKVDDFIKKLMIKRQSLTPPQN